MGRDREKEGRDEFLNACGEGDVGMIKEMIRGGQDPNARDLEFMSPLCHAVHWPEAVAALIEAGARPDDLEHLPMLSQAALSDDVSFGTFRLLAEAGGSFPRLELDGDAPTLAGLADSSEGGAPAAEKALFLVARGDDIDAKDEKGRTALMLASGSALVEALASAGARADGAFPLHNCAVCGRTEDIDDLVRMGYDPNEIGTAHKLGTAREPTTALHLAASYDNAGSCAALIRAGADIGIRDSKGRTAEDLARDPGTKAVLVAAREAIELEAAARRPAAADGRGRRI